MVANKIVCLHTGEIMVIVEFCVYGNVQNYLARHRDYFIDQISDGVIDPTILTMEQRSSHCTSPDYRR